jgi:hypothetical protein
MLYLVVLHSQKQTDEKETDMPPFSFLVTPLSIFLSLSTATGVFVHDTRVDKAALSVISAPSTSAGYQSSTKLVNYATDSHTHVERHSLSQSLHELRSENPRVQPRTSNEKKYLTNKSNGFGRSPLESYAFPLS